MARKIPCFPAGVKLSNKAKRDATNLDTGEESPRKKNKEQEVKALRF
jgi:hypothetical protein